MILHVVAAPVWDAVPPGGSYAPPSLADEGFVHCTGDDATLLQVINAFYRSVPDELIVLTVDEARLASETTWEAPAHLTTEDGAPLPDAPSFPHVYGPLERDAVTLERRVVRTADGTALEFVAR